MIRKLAFVLAMLLLAACGGTAAADATPPDPLIVARTRGLRPFDAVFLGCEQPGTPLVIREALPGERDAQADLHVQWGEPAGAPAFVYAVGEDQLVLVTQVGNGVDVSIEAARALFSGQIDDWAELGGSGAVTPWVLMDFNESAALFEAGVMGNATVSGGAFLAPDPGAALAEVRADVGAIGYVPFSWASDGVNVVSTGISAPVLAISDTAPDAAAQAWLACMQGN